MSHVVSFTTSMTDASISSLEELVTQLCHLRAKLVRQRLVVFRLGGGIKILKETSLNFQEEVSATHKKPTKILFWQLKMDLFSPKRIVLVGLGVI